MSGEFAAVYVATDTNNNRFASFQMKWNHLEGNTKDETKWTSLSRAQYDTYKSQLHSVSVSTYDNSKTTSPRQLPDNAHHLIHAAYEAISADFSSKGSQAVLNLEKELSRPLKLEGADKSLYQATKQVLTELKEVYQQAKNEQHQKNENHIKTAPWLSKEGIEAIRREISAGEFELPGGIKGYAAKDRIKYIEANVERYKQSENLSLSRESVVLNPADIQSLQRINKQLETGGELKGYGSARQVPIHIARNQQGESFLSYNIPKILKEGRWENTLGEAKWVPITKEEHRFYAREHNSLGTIHQRFEVSTSDRQFQMQSQSEQVHQTILSNNPKLREVFDATVKAYRQQGVSIEPNELRLVALKLKNNPAYSYQSGTQSEARLFNRHKDQIITLENRRLGDNDLIDRYMSGRKKGDTHEVAQNRALEYVKFHTSVESDTGKNYNRFITRNELYTLTSSSNLNQLTKQLNVVDRLNKFESNERWWNKIVQGKESRLDKNLGRALDFQKTSKVPPTEQKVIDKTISQLIKDQRQSKTVLVSTLEGATKARLGARDKGLQRESTLPLGTKQNQNTKQRIAR